MRIAVTGGSGFIGSHVVDVMVEHGHEVVAIDSAVRSLNPHARYLEADVLDLGAMMSALEGVDVVFHLAGVSNVDIAQQHPVSTFRLNVEGTAVVCEAARQVGVQRVVLASTVWVYGAAVDPPEGEALTEEAPFDLTKIAHVYTASKLAAETVLHSYRQLYGLGTTILRFGIPYGPRMRDELVLARFAKKVRNGEALTIAGDGSQTRRYLYVRDMAEAHALALVDEAEGQTFALEGTEEVSVKQMAELVLKLVGSDLPLERIPARPGDFKGVPISAEHAANVLGWRPTTSFEDGVRAYLAWVEEREAAEAIASAADAAAANV